ncbi:glycosyl transferase family 1 [Bradyrhizobium manausense]|uniref:glycosyltransferase n=1 Tax=Bradyrhizobium manausense TaxID=989370 RepID=UPI001BAE00B0|nr:glycosyltransferase [Bradyrhizobium manausense]MBR1092275.1 glycosyl transferase family 1 [Bradyrhizobium manausense]
MKIVYFVHDLNHADTARRVEVLKRAGAEVVMIGFHRKAEFDPNIADVVLGLGQTFNTRFAQRSSAVLKGAIALLKHRKYLLDADAIMARNLEMLLLAALARKLCRRNVPLTYECLDIHRLMTGSGWLGRLLRRIEGVLLRQSQALVSSSPGFVENYFARTYGSLPRTIILENKIFPASSGGRPKRGSHAPGPPWRIGWFGVIRCARSLALLARVAADAPGLIEVIVAGRPASGVFPDVKSAFSNLPGINYVGGFADEDELAQLFRSVHFAWAMDFYEEGANSDWLLPNRLYRSIYYDAVPIALSTVETGKWLTRHGVGLRMDSADPDSLRLALQGLTQERYVELEASLRRIPESELVIEDEECRRLVESLADRNTIERVSTPVFEPK